MSIYKNRLFSYVYLLIGFLFLIFSNGRWILPIAAFLAPLFLIRFLRFHKSHIGFMILIFVGSISNIIIWKGMMPMSGLFYYILMFMMSLFTSLTYLIDRICSQKIKGIISSLVFPSANVILEYIVVSTNPSGSYGSLAHTQSSLPLLQILSVTGIWGLIFFITWTASFINWLWDNQLEKRAINKGLVVFGIPFMAILIFGQIRIFNTNNEKDTVRIASITINEDDVKERDDALRKIYENKDWAMYYKVTQEEGEEYLNLCGKAASSGVKIVFGLETVLSLSKDNEDSFIEKAKAIALKENIYLGLPLEVLPEGFPNVRSENKITWISPEGQIIFTYYKAKPTDGKRIYGDGKLKYFDTPYGRISTAICFDMDFPGLINQLRWKRVDIMLVPGFDWSTISPYHTYVASARAIEQGFNMVRSTGRGLSASFNYKGQVISKMDYYKTTQDIMYSDVPTKGAKTIYSVLGDYFAWLCILFFLTISLFIMIRRVS